MITKTLPVLLLFALSTILPATLAKADTPALPEGFPVTDGLVSYLDSEMIDLDAGHVARMIDRSGSGNDAIEIGTPQPSNPVFLMEATPSGMNAVRFDGIGGYLDVASKPDDFDGRGMTTFVVFRANALSVGRMINSGYATLNPDDPDALPNFKVHGMMARDVDRLMVQNRNLAGGALAAASPTGAVQTGEFYLGVNYLRENGDMLAIVRDTANNRVVGDSSGANANPQGHQLTRIGAGSVLRGPEPEEFFNGDIAAVLVYNRELDPFELLEVEEFLHAAYLGEGLAGGGVDNPPVTFGLVLHLNANEGNVLVEDGFVKQMADISGRDNHAESHVAEGEPRPAPVLLTGATPTGLNAMLFNGMESYLEIQSNPADFDRQEMTMFAIFRPRAFGTGRLLISGYETTNPDDPSVLPNYRLHGMFVQNGDNGRLLLQNRNLSGGARTASAANGSIYLDEFYLGVNHLDLNGDMTAVVRNTANERFTGQGTLADANPQNHQLTRIGAGSEFRNAGVTDYFNGDIAAIVIFNRALAESELLEVEEFLYNAYLNPVSSALSYDNWVAGFDLPEQLRGPNADASGDGVVNVLKFAFGLDPREASLEGLPVMAVEEIDEKNYLILTIMKNPNATGLVYQVEASSDLISWSSDPQTIVVIEDNDDLLKARTFQSLDDEGKLNLFVRGRVFLD